MNNNYIYNVYDVFTPSSPATVTFVERESINDRLVNALKTPGKQLVIFGNSGSGKTTLLKNKLTQTYENHITTSCTSQSTFDQLIADGFDQISPYYSSEFSNTAKNEILSSLKSDYLILKAQVDSKSSEDITVKQSRILPPQLTIQKLGSLIGEAGCCWVIEDFHRIPLDEKRRLSEVMKIFMDMASDYNNLKIILIGTEKSARDIAYYHPDMRNRVAEIHVPLMSDEEIIEIIERGEQCLNIALIDQITDNILVCSNGLASVCHQLALNLCLNYDIYQTQDETAIFNINDFDRALRDYIEDQSDTIKAIFESSIKLNSRLKYNYYEIILKIIAKNNEYDGLTGKDIYDEFRNLNINITQNRLIKFLSELASHERGEIIRFDKDSARYDYSNPFYKTFARTLSYRINWKRSIERFMNEPLPSFHCTVKELNKTEDK